MERTRSWVLVCLASLTFSACSGKLEVTDRGDEKSSAENAGSASDDGGPGAPPEADAALADASPPCPPDGGSELDAGEWGPDAGAWPPDAGWGGPDAGEAPADAGWWGPDAEAPSDGGVGFFDASPPADAGRHPPRRDGG